MSNIFVTRKIPETGIEKLKQVGHSVDVSEKDYVLTKEELVTALKQKEYDAVLCLLTDKVDGDIFDAAPKAKIFANYAVGFNNVDVDEAKKRGIIISNTPEVLTNTVAEHAFALMLAIAHRIPEADRFVRAGKYIGWAPELLLGNDLSGKTLGVLGAGRIGTRVAYHGAKSFDMKVLYYDIKRNEHIEKEVNAEFRESVEDVLKEADFITVHVPLLDSTRHLVNKERLELMKPTAYIVNSSRGPVIDEVALVEALKNKTIKGAALDVFENEPKLTDGLAELDNVVLTPHIASATEETRGKMAELAAENIIAVLEGKEAPNKVGSRH
ncbi:D-glycerate dehydrogenase [bacterium]|nr:D-glycerate dehydrogenase [bacterium]|tara:strand:- start:9449 stop:10426 length:978 start_codon:yes stop_codon:yes gene_type:complete